MAALRRACAAAAAPRGLGGRLHASLAVQPPDVAAGRLAAAVAAAAAAAAVASALRSPRWARADDRGDADADLLRRTYQLPEPLVCSDAGEGELWELLGVAVSPAAEAGRRCWALRPQPQASYRALGPEDEARLRDARGAPVGPERNPGVRVEPNFISESEEAAIAEEVRALVRRHGSVMGGSRAYADRSAGPSGGLPVRLVLAADGRIVEDPEGLPGPMWRVTGRPEHGGTENPPPWGYGAQLDVEKLPPELRRVAKRIASLEGYPLGPLRDVTINLRTTSVCRLDPHIDPLADGPNCFVLTLLSGAVLTFSPVSALKKNVRRACDPAEFGMRSFTDEDVDCLSRRRALCHFAGDARYHWTHAIRPGIAVQLQDGPTEPPRVRICDWWGTREHLMERKDERISIVFAFADPPAAVR